MKNKDNPRFKDMFALADKYKEQRSMAKDHSEAGNALLECLADHGVYLIDRDGDVSAIKQADQVLLIHDYKPKVYTLVDPERSNYHHDKSNLWDYRLPTPAIWASFDYGTVEAQDEEEAYALSRLRVEHELRRINKALEPTGNTIEVDLDQIEVTRTKA